MKEEHEKDIIEKKLTADSALLILMELALDESKNKTGFADGGFAQEHEFELTDFALLSAAVRALLLSGSRCHYG